MKERPIQNIQNSQEHQQLDIFTYESVCFMLWWLLMLLFHYLWKEESSQALIPWRLKLLRSLSFFFPFFFFFPRTSPFARFSWFLIYVLVQIFVFVIGSIWVLSKMVYLCFNSWILEDSGCGFGASIVCVFQIGVVLFLLFRFLWSSTLASGTESSGSFFFFFLIIKLFGRILEFVMIHIEADNNG